MATDSGRSPSGRASRASPEPASSLGHSATIPNAKNVWLSKIPATKGVYAVFSAVTGKDIGRVERFYPTLESGHNASGCPYRRWTAKRAEWRGIRGFGLERHDSASFRTRREAFEWVVAQGIPTQRAET